MMRFLVIRLSTASMVYLFALTIAGCDAENFIPNDELTPSQLSTTNSDTIRMVLNTDGFDQYTGIEIDKEKWKQFAIVLAKSRRNSVPIGFRDTLDVSVFSNSKDVCLARFKLCVSQPMIANDGREYDVSDSQIQYFALIEELLYIKKNVRENDADSEQFESKPDGTVEPPAEKTSGQSDAP